MCAHVLVAEDDLLQAELIQRYLESAGHRVHVVHDGVAALEQARRISPDLIVLDVMMPEMDGMQVCRRLRAETRVAVLMLTAQATEDDLLLGLELGADDYMTKPFSPRELAARVQALLRRAAPTEQPQRVGDLIVDPARHLVTVAGLPVDCTPAEFRVLEALAVAPGRVLTREQLLEHIHGFDRYITERTVDGHIKNLRKKIGTARIQTVYGFGYKIVNP